MGSEDQDHHAGGYQSTTGLAVTLTATFSIAGVILIIIIIIICLPLLRRRQRRRNHNLLSLISTQIAPTNVNSAESPNSGLDPVIIASLPRILYKQTEQFSQGEVMQCSVCLGTIVEDAAIRILPNCKHMFHVDCVDMWFTSNKTCPVCRAMAEPRARLGHDNLATEVQPTATLTIEDGGVSRDINHESEKVGMGCSGSRTASFPRMIISRERSLRRDHSYDESAVISEADLERQ